MLIISDVLTRTSTKALKNTRHCEGTWRLKQSRDNHLKALNSIVRSVNGASVHHFCHVDTEKQLFFRISSR